MYPTDTSLRKLATKCDYCGLLVRAPPSNAVKVAASREVVVVVSVFATFTSFHRGFDALFVVFRSVLWSCLCLSVCLLVW